MAAADERSLLEKLRSPTGTTLHVDPPASWARWKPAVVPLLGEFGRRGGRLIGYPLCAVGESWRALARVSVPARSAHPPCGSCGRAASCSPAVRWNEDELQAFGPTDAESLWQRFHTRFRGATGAPHRELADRLVALHAKVLPEVWELEPSLVVRERVEPVLRLVVFHGPLPADEAAGLAVTQRVLASFWSWHELAGEDPPRLLPELLERAAPFEIPIGFELSDGPPMLKAYVRLRHLAAAERVEIVEALASLAGAARPPRSLRWDDVHMVGLASRLGKLVGLKLYVAADARAGWPELELPAMPDDHPFERLSGHRAYAVIDLAHPDARPHKWDYYLRQRLLSGPMLAALAQRVLPERAANEIAAIARHHEFHVDVVAAAVRGEAWTFYCALG